MLRWAEKGRLLETRELKGQLASRSPKAPPKLARAETQARPSPFNEAQLANDDFRAGWRWPLASPDEARSDEPHGIK